MILYKADTTQTRNESCRDIMYFLQVHYAKMRFISIIMHFTNEDFNGRILSESIHLSHYPDITELPNGLQDNEAEKLHD